MTDIYILNVDNNLKFCFHPLELLSNRRHSFMFPLLAPPEFTSSLGSKPSGGLSPAYNYAPLSRAVTPSQSRFSEAPGGSIDRWGPGINLQHLVPTRRSQPAEHRSRNRDELEPYCDSFIEPTASLSSSYPAIPANRVSSTQNITLQSVRDLDSLE